MSKLAGCLVAHKQQQQQQQQQQSKDVKQQQQPGPADAASMLLQFKVQFDQDA